MSVTLSAEAEVDKRVSSGSKSGGCNPDSDRHTPLPTGWSLLWAFIILWENDDEWVILFFFFFISAPNWVSYCLKRGRDKEKVRDDAWQNEKKKSILTVILWKMRTGMDGLKMKCNTSPWISFVVCLLRECGIMELRWCELSSESHVLKMVKRIRSCSKM